MCNGWNHGDGCACGFGPPYPWKITRDRRSKWHESAIFNTGEYKRGLSDLGLSEIQISQETNSYKGLGFPVSRKTWGAISTEKKSDWKSRFLDLFNQYKFEEIEHTHIKIDIPIFRLHSPKTKNSKVTYSQTMAVGKPDAWFITVLGFGTGDSQVFRLENTSEFSSEAGNCKLVHLPVRLRLTSLRVYRGKQFIKKALKVEPSPDHSSEIMNEGVKKQPSRDCKLDQCSKTGKVEVFPLVNEHEGSLNRYTRTLSSESEQGFSAEVGAFNVKGTLRANVQRKAAITLSFELPGGFDYRMHHVEEPDGLVWELE